MSTSTHSIALDLPAPLAQALTRAAEITYRSVEDLVVSTLQTMFLISPDLPPDIAAELQCMQFFSDERLQVATKSCVSPAELERLHQLNAAAGDGPLTPAEKREQADLLQHYQLSALRRAQAFAVLAQRGHRLPTDDELKAELYGQPQDS